MITKIIACADIHIRNLRRQEEYKKVLDAFINECKKITEENGEENTRIVVAGDLLHNKLDISGEGYLLASWFLKELDKVATTIVIAGNHDMNMSNLSRLDPITTIFSMCKFERVFYLDQSLGYESGCLEDENVVWCLYSTFDNFAKPNIGEYRISYPDKTFVGLFHGDVKSAKTDAGYQSENGIEPSYFGDLDFAILGHIHKRQEIKTDGVPLVYCGSLIQQNHGENVGKHGFVVWDVENKSYVEYDIPNEDYGFFTFTIGDIEDIDKNEERILNL